MDVQVTAVGTMEKADETSAVLERLLQGRAAMPWSNVGMLLLLQPLPVRHCIMLQVFTATSHDWHTLRPSR